MLTAAACCAALWTADAAAEPAALHLFGPLGTTADRRVLAVLETADGACAPAQELRVEAVDPRVSVTMEEVAGDCARWVRVAAARGGSVTLRAGEGEGAPTATLGLQAHDAFALAVERSGRDLVVRAARAGLDADAQVHAFWQGGDLALERAGPGYRGRVPADALVGVVARSGLRVGAALSAPAHPSDAGAAAAFIMPTGLAIHAGGAPRTAAFLLVVDRRGRPSSTVPLSIASERGRLRGLSWLAPGLAAIQLGVESWTPTVDLTVSLRGSLLSQRELPVATGWPVEARLEAPQQATAGEPFDVRVDASAHDGSAVPPALLRLRCGGDELEPDTGGAASCRGEPGSAALVVAGAMIDGRFVPLGSRRVELEPAPAPAPQPAERVAAPEPRAPRPPARRPTLGIAGFIQGGIDPTWVRGAVVVGARVELPLRSWVHLDIAAQYAAAIFEIDGGAQASGPLRGREHTAELTVAAGFEPLAVRAPERRVALLIRAGLGAAIAAVRAELGDDGDDASGEGFRATAQLSIGPRIAVGPARIDVGLGLRAALYSSPGTWPDAPIRVLLELGITWGLHA